MARKSMKPEQPSLEEKKLVLVRDVEVFEEEVDELTEETLEEMSNNKGDDE